MKSILTNFAYGNGPYCRTVEWAISLNNIRESRAQERLPIIIPLVYQERQKRIMKEVVGNSFLQKHPQEILLDSTYGSLLSSIFYKGSNYDENLTTILHNYYKVEEEVRKHLDGRRVLETMFGEKIELDLRDSEIELTFNNRVATFHKNSFYTNGGAGYFYEILSRAIQHPEIRLDKQLIQRVIPIAERVSSYQKLHMLNDPGVFSYDKEQQTMLPTELHTPPFIHTPEKDTTHLETEGIYVLVTGIDGIKESKMFDKIKKLGMKIYATPFDKSVIKKFDAIPLLPKSITNPKIIAQYTRTGWSSVWLAHLAEKAFIFPPHLPIDDPEIFFNILGIQRLGLGVVITDDSKTTLKTALDLAQKVHKFNDELKFNYSTLDGIIYTAETVADFMNGKNISEKMKKIPVSKTYNPS